MRELSLLDLLNIPVVTVSFCSLAAIPSPCLSLIYPPLLPCYLFPLPFVIYLSSSVLLISPPLLPCCYRLPLQLRPALRLLSVMCFISVPYFYSLLLFFLIIVLSLLSFPYFSCSLHILCTILIIFLIFVVLATPSFSSCIVSLPSLSCVAFPVFHPCFSSL